MKIVFIGAGNLATHLACKLYESGHSIIQIYSRTTGSAKQLAEKVDSEYVTDISKVTDQADIYVFSVKDSILEDLIEKMPHASGLWMHTAGSMPCNVFQKRISDYGVIYPMQTFSKERNVQWNDIPIFIEGSNASVMDTINSLAGQLSDNLYSLPTEKRMYIHAAAVFACNFVNHMYEQAANLTNTADIPFEVLLPLIRETCAKVHEILPHDAQTGPAVRFDTNVMDKHINLLNDNYSVEIYKLVSQSIYRSFNKEL